VFRGTSKTGKFKWVKTTTNKSYTDKKLKSSKTYYYKVRAVNGDKKGEFSAIKSAKTKVNYAAVKVDKTNKTVTIYAKVNGKYFMKSTAHLMVDMNGFNKDDCIMNSYCHPDDLYEGLAKIGGVSWSKSKDKTLKSGEKISKKNAENKDYSSFDISVSWGNESHSLSECVTTSRGGKTAPKIDMVFSGNPKAAEKTYSGCMVCFDSCYVAIVSNCKYGLDDIKVYGRSDVLPDDGKIVKVTFKLK
jgi:hypothetical protein